MSTASPNSLPRTPPLSWSKYLPHVGSASSHFDDLTAAPRSSRSESAPSEDEPHSQVDISSTMHSFRIACGPDPPLPLLRLLTDLATLYSQQCCGAGPFLVFFAGSGSSQSRLSIKFTHNIPPSLLEKFHLFLSICF